MFDGMTFKPDQERIRVLLSETITLLCRNGLNFKSQFSIEALIGITLDHSDVFLVSIKETIHSPALSEELIDTLEPSTDMGATAKTIKDESLMSPNKMGITKDGSSDFHIGSKTHGTKVGKHHNSAKSRVPFGGSATAVGGYGSLSKWKWRRQTGAAAVSYENSCGSNAKRAKISSEENHCVVAVDVMKEDTAEGCAENAPVGNVDVSCRCRCITYTCTEII